MFAVPAYSKAFVYCGLACILRTAAPFGQDPVTVWHSPEPADEHVSQTTSVTWLWLEAVVQGNLNVLQWALHQIVWGKHYLHSGLVVLSIALVVVHVSLQRVLGILSYLCLFIILPLLFGRVVSAMRELMSACRLPTSIQTFCHRVITTAAAENRTFAIKIADCTRHGKHVTERQRHFLPCKMEDLMASRPPCTCMQHQQDSIECKQRDLLQE